MCSAPALALLAPGIVAVLAHQVVLFASLGPTAMTMIQQAGQPSARVYNTFVAHLIGLASGFLIVVALGLSATPSVFEAHSVSGIRLAAAVFSLALATLLEMLLRAQHPPAAATTLLVALGSFHPNWHDATLVISGVLLVVAACMLLRTVHEKLIAH
jgi:HPP family protein